MITEILFKDRIGSKNVWLTDTGNDDVKMSALEEAGSILYCNEGTEKRSIVDNNVRSTSLWMSSLGEISLNLRHEEYLQYRQGTSKSFPACYYVDSFILLWQFCILFFLKLFFNFFHNTEVKVGSRGNPGPWANINRSDNTINRHVKPWAWLS